MLFLRRIFQDGESLEKSLTLATGAVDKFTDEKVINTFLDSSVLSTGKSCIFTIFSCIPLENHVIGIIGTSSLAKVEIDS